MTIASDGPMTTGSQEDPGIPDAVGPGTGSDSAPESGAAVTSEAQGGAGMMEEAAPIGFTADVGGKPGSTDDPEEARQATVPAAAHGPRTRAEELEADGEDPDQEQ